VRGGCFNGGEDLCEFADVHLQGQGASAESFDFLAQPGVLVHIP
jgi:hypothetical protein